MVDFYQCKIHESLAHVYTDLFLYKSTKFHFEKSEEIRARDAQREEGQRVFSKLDELKFDLKAANKFKKNGFYWTCKDLINKLEEKVNSWTKEDIEDSMELTHFKFRVLRDKARVSSLMNDQKTTDEYMKKAEDVLGDSKEENIKFAKL